MSESAEKDGLTTDATDDLGECWEVLPGDRFLPFQTSAWMNEHDCGFHYSVLEQATSLPRAIKRGLATNGSDDFNIGVIRDGRMVAILWMERELNEEAEVIHRIGHELGVHE